MSHRQVPPESPYFVLRQGTQRLRSEEVKAGGVIVARGLSNFMKPSLDPKGVNKLLITELKDIIVTRDGARMLESMSFSYPIAWLLQDAAKSVEKSVGDWSKTAIILIGELAKRLASIVNPKKNQICMLVNECKTVYEMALKKLRELPRPFKFYDYSVMKKIEKTILSSRD